ncbi:MAG: hypothetical protein DYG89_33640 [Caldilinea sp. CFX5]|nr:hypothetical protein [Caldilinea sp. CFX5]
MTRFPFKRPRRLALFAALVPVLLLTCFVSYADAQAQEAAPVGLPVEFKEAYEQFAQLRDLIAATEEILTNYQECVALHGNEDSCARAAIMCHLQETAIGALYPSWVSDLQIFGAFQIYCGADECFQCCKTPDGGCHTSFKGFPVINCNDNYGVGTFPAGMTFITDPNVEPGAACLTTPQTCDHIPACRYVPGVDIEEMERNPDPNDPLNLDDADKQRARYFAEFLQTQLQKFLDDFFTGEFDDIQLAAAHTASPFARLAAIQSPSLYELGYFITGRGCQQWRSKMSGGYGFDWSHPLFAITDTNGAILDAASHWNGLQQLMTMRVLASIPHAQKRLDYTDSRVWTQASKTAYLAQVGDPDQALLRYMSPFALEILKGVYSIQDYRLLAVPRPDEPVLTNQFNGCTLGKPPRLALKATNSTPDTIALEITITNPLTTPSTTPGVMIVDWGDGHVSHLEYAAAQAKVTASHTYATAGKRLIMAMTDNESGLRGLGALVVEATAGAGTVTPAVAQVTLDNLVMRIETLSGNEWRSFLKLALTDAQSRTVGAGRTANLLAKFEQDTTYGRVHVHNPGRYAFDKVVIEPVAGPGFTIGFREHYITLDGLILSVYASALDDYITRTIPITTSMVRVYPVGSGTLLTPTLLTVTDDGKVKIPLQRLVDFEIETMARIELLIDPAWSQGLVIPAATAYTVGDSRTQMEVRPDRFLNEQTLTFPSLPARMVGDAPFTVSATASSGLSVTLTSTTTAVCAVSGNTVTLIAPGRCTLVAGQPGNDTYLAAPNVEQSFAVGATLYLPTVRR